ncbi:MAG: PQQ-binding-like beta-propeller repeat protein [Candidatus Eisenbacteria bacterium]|uniref:PQQ-binding-like beta-propeller repeat protein n=1 Tax=Eiseniibacteriota bacterium TaxID=2212470 RepID=A0A948W5I7_UNCEI|nr:PQQ-binding-like beta-propeller repeat protein [Candidatus Eisenbacteria bacterium]MBU1947199.1 PQQ-binding-like beta-propeller repeat protein [Candidatus Eisenbacteria bacterium]MBU2693352.1 PQQ-binding-like beta-propeller repeat protein [Candidatus Eisenbacteria bacterium]
MIVQHDVFRILRGGSFILTLLFVAPWLGFSAALADGTLFFTDIFNPSFSDGFIRRVETDGTGLQTVLSGGGGLRGIAVYPDSEYVYYTDVDLDQIRRCNFDGGNVRTLVYGPVFPMEIAIDPAADLLVWGDQGAGVIGVAHLDGTGAHTLLTTSFAAGLALDTVNGKIYWSTALTGSTGEILRADYDGSNSQTVVSESDRPARLALDISGGKVYWTDYVVDVVRRANLDGTEVETIFDAGGNHNPDGICLDLAAGKVYWGQEGVQVNREMIKCMNFDGTAVEDVIDGFGIVASIDLKAAPFSSVGSGPAAMRLLTVSPNPFAGSAALRLDLPQDASIRLSIYSVDGRRITTLHSGILARGRHQLIWDGTDQGGVMAPPGVYFCRMDAGAAVEKIPMVLIQ